MNIGTGPHRTTFVNGEVWTQGTGRSRTAVLTVQDGRVVPSTEGAVTGQVIDLKGAHLVPGFIETHTHPITFGLSERSGTNMGRTTTPDISTIQDRLANVPGQTWIRALGYDDTALTEKRHPTGHDLDEAVRDRPVYLRHISGHFCVLNTLAMRLLGIHPETGNDLPDEGVYRDDRGEPTGVFAEKACFWVARHLPNLTSQEMAEAISTASAEFARHGITTIHDMSLGRWAGVDNEMAAYQEARRRGHLKQKLRGYVASDACTPHDLDGISQHFSTDDDVTLIGVKYWVDGSIQGYTAFLNQDYLGRPGERGDSLTSVDELVCAMQSAIRQHHDLAIHCNGDAAIDAALDAMQVVGTSKSSTRVRIEHCQMATEPQILKLVRHGAYVSFFVKHIKYWGDRHRDLFIGQERASRMNPLAFAAQSGLTWALHSDAPVTPPSPLEGMDIAVQRRTAGGDLLGESEKVSFSMALDAYTSQAAKFSGESSRLGSLLPGSAADFVVMRPGGSLGYEVEATFESGQPIYLNPSRSALQAFGCEEQS